MSNSTNQARDRAKRLLSHYIRVAFEDNHRRWNEDHQNEVEEIVDSVIDAVKQEVFAAFAASARDFGS